MEHTAHIRLRSGDTEMRFDWLGFDGDECFQDFHVTYVSGGDERRFEFGPCVVWGVRKLTRFFTDPTQLTAGLGFRHPDIRYCDVHRSGESYRLVVRYEGSGLHEELHIERPSVHVADEFLGAYDTDA
ncbi:MAG: hypothetical protein V4726_21960 [Verrucomicrobiota bacterium]